MKICPQCKMRYPLQATNCFVEGAELVVAADAKFASLLVGGGARFGRYAIERPLGQGGMGVVLLAHDTQLDRHVALKLMGSERQEERHAMARFVREARLAARISHPNTVQVHDAGMIDGHFYISMEYVAGSSLHVFCAPGDPPADTKSRWLLDVARALAHAHGLGIIHRDVKPSNILVSSHGIAKLADFGLARLADRRRGTLVTTAYDALGTPSYMAPEVLKGGLANERTDQYAWGLTAYTLFAGVNPRRDNPIAGVIDPLAPLESVAADVPRKVCDVVMKALRADPSERHGTMEEVISALEGRRLRGPSAEPKAAGAAVVAPDEPTRAGSPKAWKTVVHREPASPVAPVRAAAFLRAGVWIVAFGPRGCAVRHFDEVGDPTWTRFTEGSLARAAAGCGDRECVLISGEDRYVAQLWFEEDGRRLPRLAARKIFAPYPRREDAMTFHGAYGAPGAEVVVGRRGDGSGVIAEVIPFKMADADGALHVVVVDAPMHAVARLRDGTIVGGGEDGALVAVKDGTVQRLPAPPNFSARAMTACEDGVYVVGTGPDVLRVTNDRRVTSEATSGARGRFVAVAASEGDVFVASESGAILYRYRNGEWGAVVDDAPEEGAAAARIVALWAERGRFSAVRADGAVVSGWR